MAVLSLHVKHCAHKCYNATTLCYTQRKKFPRRAFSEQNENLSNCPRTNYVHHYFLLFSDHGVLWTIDWLFIQTMNNVLVQKRGKVWSLGLVFCKKKSSPFYLYANGPWSWVKHSLYLVPTQHLNWLFFDTDLLLHGIRAPGASFKAVLITSRFDICQALCPPTFSVVTLCNWQPYQWPPCDIWGEFEIYWWTPRSLFTLVIGWVSCPKQHLTRN